MKVICIKNCKGNLSGRLFFTKGKFYEFDESGILTDNTGHKATLHLDSNGKNPLQKWNNYYRGGPHPFYKAFKPADDTFTRF